MILDKRKVKAMHQPKEMSSIRHSESAQLDTNPVPKLSGGQVLGNFLTQLVSSPRNQSFNSREVGKRQFCGVVLLISNCKWIKSILDIISLLLFPSPSRLEIGDMFHEVGVEKGTVLIVELCAFFSQIIWQNDRNSGLNYFRSKFRGACGCRQKKDPSNLMATCSSFGIIVPCLQDSKIDAACTGLPSAWRMAIKRDHAIEGVVFMLDSEV